LLETFEAAWQTIDESHYDPTFGGIDWKAVREEFRPLAMACRNREELRDVIETMLERLGLSHMGIIPGEIASVVEQSGNERSGSSGPPGNMPAGRDPSSSGKVRGEKSKTPGLETADSSGAGDPGFDVRLIGGNLVVTQVDPSGPAARAGIRTGWILQQVGNTPLSGRLEQIGEALVDRHKQVAAWRLAHSLLNGSPGSTVRVGFHDGEGNARTMAVPRRHLPGQPVKFGLLPTMHAHFESRPIDTPAGARIGYLRFNLWMIPIAQPFDQAVDTFRAADGIIIDLRGNIGGIAGMILGLSGHFFKERVSLGVMKMRGNELHFFTNPRLVNSSGRRVEPYGGPLAILTDEISLSAAEIFAGGMQAVHRARIFGQTSGGQALPAVWTRLPNGDVLYHALADFLTPDGVRLEGRGVIPDVFVPLTRENLLAGRDRPLEAAIQWIDQERKPLQN
jgi:carboxyl-terminal processing protease